MCEVKLVTVDTEEVIFSKKFVNKDKAMSCRDFFDKWCTKSVKVEYNEPIKRRKRNVKN